MKVERPQHRPARRDPADRVRREGRHAHPRQEPGGPAARGSRASCPRRDARFESSYRKPYGTILVTGPTGSGKSTTLYATLNQLNTPDRNIITVEDPVEYRLPGINQVQIHPKAGLTFAAALRSILRADPDIVLVGEIRDKETAVIAHRGRAHRSPRVRNCVNTWSMLGSVLTSKLTVICVWPLFALTEYM